MNSKQRYYRGVDMKNNEQSNQKPLYEKIEIWISIVAGICAILGISVTGIKFSNRDVIPVAEPSPKPMSVEFPPPEGTLEDLSQPGTNSSTFSKDGLNFQDQSDNAVIPISEIHIPKDFVSVYCPNWDIDSDYGIDGNRYSGGIKVTISYLFTALGSSISEDISSRISFPISNELKESTPMEERLFTGSFILHESMYGSKSTATVKIVVNNEIVFSTELNSDVTEAAKFEINFGDADSIIIETDATLRGSDFVFGIVNSNE